MSKDNLQFDSNLELAKPSQVIFHMLETAIREGRVGLDNNMLWSRYDPARNIDDEVDAYIDREVRRGQMKELQKLRNIYDMLPALPGSKHDEFKESLIAFVDGRIDDLDPDATRLEQGPSEENH